MKKILFYLSKTIHVRFSIGLFLIFFSISALSAQVGIGTENPEASSIFDVTSTSKGFLVPRMTESQKNAISSPAQGLLVFQTNGTVGFYSYDGSSWLHLIDGSSKGLYFGPGTGNGDNNLAVGTSMGSGTGKRNTAIGSRALENYSGSGFDNNTAVGYYSLKKVTDGQQNTALGAETMFELTSGNWNTAIGAQTIINSTGNGNTALGYRAGETLTTGSNNILIGMQADVSSNNLSNAIAIGYDATVNASNKIQLGNSNITLVETSGTVSASAFVGDGSGLTGIISSSSTPTFLYGTENVLLDGTTSPNVGDMHRSVGLGYLTLNSVTTGNKNVAIGARSMKDNTTGYMNVGIGWNSLTKNTTGGRNIAIGGSEALDANTTGSNNLAIGDRSMTLNVSGQSNVAIGSNSLLNNNSGNYNTMVGVEAGSNIRTESGNTGNDNVGLGYRALQSNYSGDKNVAIGWDALRRTKGSGNSGIGNKAGWYNVDGSNNTFVGNQAGIGSSNATNLTNATAIGYNAIVDASNKIQLGNSNVTNLETSGSITAGAITIPNTDGSANQVLKTDGSGSLSWTTISSSSGVGIIAPEEAFSVTLSDSDHGKIFFSQHSNRPEFPDPDTLSAGFTCTIVNYSNYDGTMTSPSTTIIGTRSNSMYPAKDHAGVQQSVHAANVGGKNFPVSNIGFSSGGTIQIRVITISSSNYYYVTGDFYYK